MKNERQHVAKTVSVTEDFNHCLKIIVWVLTLQVYIIDIPCIE